MISPPRTCVTALSPTSASVSTFLGPRSTARQPRPRHSLNRIGKRWQRRGHLLVDETRLCHRKQLPILATKMINTTRKSSPQMQPPPIVLAAAVRARQKSEPGGRLVTLSYRYGEEEAQPKYGGELWVPAASGVALALLTIGLVPGQ